MDTKTHITTPSDAVLLAYGKEVSALLSSSSAERWKEELWKMFDGYILGLLEMGHDPELHRTYFCFKELLEFFEEVERIRVGGMTVDLPLVNRHDTDKKLMNNI